MELEVNECTAHKKKAKKEVYLKEAKTDFTFWKKENKEGLDCKNKDDQKEWKTVTVWHLFIVWTGGITSSPKIQTCPSR